MTTLVDVAEYLETKFNGLKSKYSIDTVYYGDQNKMVGSRCVCIDPNLKRITDYSAGMKLAIPQFIVIIYVYSLNITDPGFNRKEADRLAEKLEAEVNFDSNLGGLVMDGYVSLIESGYATVNASLARVTKMTYEANNRERIGGPVV